MRIGIEAQRIFRAKKHGMDVVALETLLSLQQLDKKNEYFVFVKPDEDNQCILPSENMHIIPISGISYPDWEQIQLPRTAKKYNLDLLHCTSNTAPLYTNIPTLITLHDIIYLEQLNFGGTAYQNFGNLYRRFVVPKVVKNAKAIITVSEFEKQQILNGLEIDQKKIEVIYNAINNKFHCNYSSDELKRVRIQYKLPNEFILFLGNKAPKKNTENVVKAYIKYLLSSPNVLPLVILDYEKHLVEAILKTINSERYIDSFCFPGYISSAEIPKLYNLAKLFLYPSLRESFGLPIIEAMACGTPVLTSDTSSMPEIAGNAAVLVNPYDIKDMAQKISGILSDEEQISVKIQSGLTRASYFSWENTARKVLNMYKSLI
ncbi:MAG: glycosyltransferase family 1 protein [Cytophagales bacterium]|nr:MAG: glycosyltransferase family 1 protein [Cytophagales bacterium]